MRSNSTSIHTHHNKSLSVSQSTGSLSNINISYGNGNVPLTISEDEDASTIGNALSTSLITDWIHALEAFDKGKLKDALYIFNAIEPKNSKINYNIASIYATLGEYDTAISYFKLAIENDNYMAISYFQIGVCRFLSGLYKKAAGSFNTALKLLRGNSVVNYQQLGLEYKLYSCEIMYNRALSYIYSGQMTVGIYDLGFAIKEKRYIAEHRILEEALRHFSKSEEFIKNDDIDIRNMLKLPENFDSKAQRFSILGPPKAEYYKTGKEGESSQSSSPLSGKVINTDAPAAAVTLDSLSKEEEDEAPKKMVYSLFSVPQGALFRLTETKVQSILNDKYIGAMIMGKPYPQPSVLQPAFKEKSALRNKGSQSGFEANMKPPQTATHSHSGSADSTQPSVTEYIKHHSSKNSSGSSVTVPLKQPKKMPSLPSLPSTATKSSGTASAQHSNQSSMSSDYQNDLEMSRAYMKFATPQVNEAGPDDVDDYYMQQQQQPQQKQQNMLPSEHIAYHNQQQYNQHNRDMHTTPPLHIKTPPAVNGTANAFNQHNAPLPSPPIEQPGDEVGPAIKVKIHFAKETRVTIVHRGISYSEFKARIGQKLNTGASNNASRGMSNRYRNELEEDDDDDEDHHSQNSSSRLFLRVKDEDGDLVLLGDQEDLDVALEEAVLNHEPRTGSSAKATTVKLAVYCEVMAPAQSQGGVQFL
ncbi:hypothetical protein D0Z00_003530 [Geotrichum galactomycetum]|uniref:Uncharacterized protein n=1 Tax=Geotrichum galactomycetum TaxID=27317 RepID=A0ACB6V0Z1_9ASCO|nr:hypothetical protein D0Z00_003530 [Geotrichum candidum]